MKIKIGIKGRRGIFLPSDAGISPERCCFHQQLPDEKRIRAAAGQLTSGVCGKKSPDTNFRIRQKSDTACQKTHGAGVSTLLFLSEGRNAFPSLNL